MQRVRSIPHAVQEGVRQAAAADPRAVDAHLTVADLDLFGGHVEDAFRRLVDLVRVTAGDERARVRARLLDHFEIVGPDDPRVVRARRELANALF
jgi:putative thioredoxin